MAVGASSAARTPRWNQQKFAFTLQGGSVAAKAGTGFYTKVDLGIAKYHFEIGAGTAQFRWAP